MTATLEQTVLTVGDTVPGLTGRVDANLTGATLEAHVRRPDQTVLTKALTVVTAAEGTWRLPSWAEGDLNAAGDYELEVEVTFAGGEQQTFWADPTSGAAVVFYVRDQFA